jgi:hypothetical protein
MAKQGAICDAFEARFLCRGSGLRRFLPVIFAAQRPVYVMRAFLCRQSAARARSGEMIHSAMR